jgi:hypothetical protein
MKIRLAVSREAATLLEQPDLAAAAVELLKPEVVADVYHELQVVHSMITGILVDLEPTAKHFHQSGAR